ncbi:chemotaxis protein CheW [Tindallia californiensis]|uniref:Purine-binding chemotaxis protein CheW n=1 Tax=Tindallia californiensis TaxID=159292 RepID=A0A1H3I542_9FIRM|nr:chemotaxis protein CheW [Tindallia californiensis]SDY22752.1 purine-binding chemotaxis protein CheW [Tindallia californiensis]
MNGKALTFFINEKMFGLDIKLVKEISRKVEFSEVPDSDPNIVGLMNLRGQVVTLFRLSNILELESSSQNDESACIILKALPNQPHQIGFLIDRTGDVVDIQDGWCEKTPANVEEVKSEYIKEVVKLDNKLLLMLDTDVVFDTQ